jgi:hypothetical protein
MRIQIRFVSNAMTEIRDSRISQVNGYTYEENYKEHIESCLIDSLSNLAIDPQTALINLATTGKTTRIPNMTIDQAYRPKNVSYTIACDAVCNFRNIKGEPVTEITLTQTPLYRLLDTSDPKNLIPEDKIIKTPDLLSLDINSRWTHGIPTNDVIFDGIFFGPNERMYVMMKEILYF